VPFARARGHLPALSGPLQALILAPSEVRQTVMARLCVGRLMSTGCGDEKLGRELRVCSPRAGMATRREWSPRVDAPHHVTHATGASSAAISRYSKTNPMAIP